MYYLSFDVANKSLAVSLIYFNNFVKKYKYDTSKEINKIKSVNDLIEFNKKINSSIKYIYYNVEDLIPGKKVKDTDILERSSSLKKYLYKVKDIINTLKEEENIDKIYLLIEYQLSSNYNANAIYNQIIYEFSDDTNVNTSHIIYEITIMNPSYKNKIYFNKDLKHSNFIQKYNNNYIANKNHTKANFLYFIKHFNLEHVIKGIKAKNIDDLADSFLQIFGFIQFIQK
jgi:hypothetical protein